MPTEAKRQLVQDLTEWLGRSTVVILADYRGLSARDMEQLRRQLKESGADLRVIKNTLAARAAIAAGKDALCPLLEGPTAAAVGFDADVTVPARTLTEHLRTTRLAMKIKGGLVAGRALTAAQVSTLAVLPSRDVLLSQVVGAVQGPIAAMVGVLAAVPSSLVGVLEARLNQLQEAT
jgi:large subunit ribosomal protein L10